MVGRKFLIPAGHSGKEYIYLADSDELNCAYVMENNSMTLGIKSSHFSCIDLNYFPLLF